MAEEDFSEGTRKTLFKRKTQVMTKDQKEFWNKMSKIKPAVWKEMNTFMDHTKEIMASGGLVNFYKSQLDQMVDTLISSLIDPLIAPLLEAFAPIMAELLEEIIPTLQDTITVLGESISTILGIDLPGGETVGSMLTKILEFSFKFIGIIPLIMNIDDLISWVWKKLGDIFGFETEGKYPTTGGGTTGEEGAAAPFGGPMDQSKWNIDVDDFF